MGKAGPNTRYVKAASPFNLVLHSWYRQYLLKLLEIKASPLSLMPTRLLPVQKRANSAGLGAPTLHITKELMASGSFWENLWALGIS